MTKMTVAALLALSLSSGPALSMGVGGGGGGGGGFAAGVPDPYKYYPVCPRGRRAGVECQCRITGAENANMVCRVGEACDPRSGTCGAPGRGFTR